VANFLDGEMAYLLTDIKTMRLYHKPEILVSLFNNLREIGKSTGPLSYTDLLPYDQVDLIGKLLARCVFMFPNSITMTESRRLTSVPSSLDCVSLLVLCFVGYFTDRLLVTTANGKNVINVGSGLGGPARYAVCQRCDRAC